MTRYKDRFHQAARDGYLDLLRDASRRECDSPDEDGMTPVMWAAFSGNLDALRLLISRGGNPDKVDLMGNSSLHFAAANGHMHCVTFLVNFGANIWILDNDFHSALDVASLRDHTDIMEFLDTVVSKQHALNRRVVMKMRERAAIDAQKRSKKYQKMLNKTSKKLAKEDKHMQKTIELPDGATTAVQMRNKLSNKINLQRYSSGDEVLSIYKNGSGTLVHRNSGSDLIVPQSVQQSSNNSSKTYSDYVTGSTKKPFKPNFGGARKIINRRLNNNNSIHSDNNDDRRSLATLPGDTDVAYAYSRSFDGKSILSGPTSEPDFAFLPGGSNHVLNDSGLGSSLNNPGLFERPGFGSVAFFHRPRTTETLKSLNSFGLANDSSSTFQHSPSRNNTKTNYADSIGTSRSLLLRQWKDLPWSEEDVQTLDEDPGIESSDLELFLACLNLTDYVPLFNREQLDLEALLLCTDADLQSLGLPLGPRKKIMEGITRRRDVYSTAKCLQDLKL